MSTEKLTAENIMEDISSVEEKYTPGNGITQNAFDYGVERINDFVNQKTKQLKKERDRAMSLLDCANHILSSGTDINPGSLFNEVLSKFLTQLNQNNEG